MFRKSDEKAKQKVMAIKRFSDYAIKEIDTPNSIFDLYDSIDEEFSNISSPKKKSAKTLDLYIEVISTLIQHYVSQGDVEKCYQVWSGAIPQVVRHQKDVNYIPNAENRLAYQLGYNLVSAKQFACFDHPFKYKIFGIKAEIIYDGMIQAAIDNYIVMEKDKKRIKVDDQGIKFLISKFMNGENKKNFMGYWLLNRGIADEWDKHKINLLNFNTNFIVEKALRFSNKYQLSFSQATQFIYFKDLYKITDDQAKSLLTKSTWLWFVMSDHFLNKIWIAPNGRIPLDVFLHIASFSTKLEFKENKALYDAITVRRRQVYDDLKTKQKPGFWNLRKKKDTSNQPAKPNSELSRQAKK